MAVLADPTRQHIVEMLSRGELSSGEIANRFEISAPAISQHLHVLKQAHFVRSRVQGHRRIYALDPAGFVQLENWFLRIKQFWRKSNTRLPAPTLESKIRRLRINRIKAHSVLNP